MKKIIKLLIVITIVVIGGLFAVILTTDINQYKDQIVKLVEDNTGRAFAIDGELKLAPSLIPTVTVENVSFGNAHWAKQPEMLKVGLFEARVALLPLLSKNIEIKRLVLNDASILLEKNKAGDANWALAATEQQAEKDTQPSTESGALPALNINQVSINNASLVYTDAVSGKSEKIIINAFTVETDSLDKPLEIALDAVYNEIDLSMEASTGSINALTNNSPFSFDISSEVGNIELTAVGLIDKPTDAKGVDVTVSLQMDSLKDLSAFTEQEIPDVGPIAITGSLADDKQAYLIKALTVSVDDITLNANGKISDPTNAKGIEINFDFNVDKLSKLNKLAGSELPEMGPLAVNGTIKDSDGGYALNPFKLQFAETDIAGNAAVNLSGERPALNASFKSNLIDLTPFISEEEKAPAKGDKVFSSDPLPLEGLKAANVALELAAMKIKTNSHDLTNVDVGLKLNNGNLAISKLNADILGGKLNGNLSLSPQGKSAKLDTKLDLSNLQLSQLPDLKDKISGAATSITINGKGSGESVAAIMAGLNGKLLVETGSGKISSGALKVASADVLAKTLSLLRTGEKRDGSILECAVVNFAINDGMATADQGIAIMTNELNVLGSGTVNLKTEELDIGITPKARKGVGISVGQLAELVRLGGTLANPKPKTDTKAALTAGLSAGAAVATGGLSLLAQGLLDKSGSNKNSCDVALGKAPSKTATKQEAPTESKNPVEKTTKSVKDAAGAVGEKLKGLFN